MKNLENFEVERLVYVLSLVKDEIEKNNKMYSKMLRDTEDYDSFDDSDLDINLLYVAMTRAMHTLDVII